MKDNIKLVFNRSEVGAGTRGSSLGINALIIAAINKGNHFFIETPSVTVKDDNNKLIVPIVDKTAKHIDTIIKVYEDVCKNVSTVLQENKFPLVISGDHSSAGGTIAGIKNAHPDKRIGIVWIDAHADLHSPYTTPSGNVHGMPLATVLDEDNLDRDRGLMTPETAAKWDQLKNIGGHRPKAMPQDLVFISVRDTEEQEEHLMAKHNIMNYTTEMVRERGITPIVEEIKNERLADCDIIYVTFDVDSLDCIAVSHGTGTPVENGLYVDEAKELLHQLVAWNKVVTLEVTEINPLLDEKKNLMAETALEIIEHAFEM